MIVASKKFVGPNDGGIASKQFVLCNCASRSPHARTQQIRLIERVVGVFGVCRVRRDVGTSVGSKASALHPVRASDPKNSERFVSRRGGVWCVVCVD